MQVSSIPSPVPAMEREPLQQRLWRHISCTASCTNSQASWCQFTVPSAPAPALADSGHDGQHQRASAAPADVTAPQPLLLYDHWALQSLTVQLLRSGSHADVTGQVQGAAWDADWLELPQQGVEAVLQEPRATGAQQDAVCKVMQWHGDLARDGASPEPQGQAACMDHMCGQRRFKMTDPDLQPCSCAVADGAGSSAVGTGVEEDTDAFFAASCVDQAAAVEMHQVMAGCCTKSLLSLTQLDCTAHGLVLASVDTADGPDSQEAEAVAVTATVRVVVCVWGSGTQPSRGPSCRGTAIVTARSQPWWATSVGCLAPSRCSCAATRWCTCSIHVTTGRLQGPGCTHLLNTGSEAGRWSEVHACVQGLHCLLDIDVAIAHLAALQQAATFMRSLAVPAVTARAATPESEMSPKRSPVPHVPAHLGPYHAAQGGSGLLSTQPHQDCSTWPATPSRGLQRLRSGGSLYTAASTAASLPPQKLPAPIRWLRAASVSLMDVEGRVAVGPADELAVQLDGTASDAGRSCAMRSVRVKLNGCTLVDVANTNLQISTARRLAYGMDDLTAQVRITRRPTARCCAGLRLILDMPVRGTLNLNRRSPVLAQTAGDWDRRPVLWYSV